MFFKFLHCISPSNIRYSFKILPTNIFKFLSFSLTFNLTKMSHTDYLWLTLIFSNHTSYGFIMSSTGNSSVSYYSMRFWPNLFSKVSPFDWRVNKQYSSLSITLFNIFVFCPTRFVAFQFEYGSRASLAITPPEETAKGYETCLSTWQIRVLFFFSFFFWPTQICHTFFINVNDT